MFLIQASLEVLWMVVKEKKFLRQIFILFKYSFALFFFYLNPNYEVLFLIKKQFFNSAGNADIKFIRLLTEICVFK